MNNHQAAKSKSITHLIFILTVCACTLPIGTSYGKEASKSKNPSGWKNSFIASRATQPATVQRIVRVYPLKYADAKHVSETINKIFKGDDLYNTVTCAADTKTNALIISMSEKLEKKVLELLPKLDVQTETTPAEPSEIRTYALAHTKAGDLANILRTILGRQVQYGYTGNNIVIAAPKNLHEQANKIISELDQPIVEPDHVTNIIQLKNVPFKDIEKSFDFMTSGKGVLYTVDKRRNILIVRTAPQNIPLVRETLAKLDQPGPKKPQISLQSMKVRIVWLISGNEKIKTDPPADLKDAIDALDKVGISNLKLASQHIVQVFPNGQEFEMTSTPSTGKRCNFHIAGSLKSIEDSKTQLDISLDGDLEWPERNNERPFHLETTIQSPIGHSIVLGVLPLDNLTSVFIVQVTPGS